MSRDQTSVFGTIVITMCVTAAGLVGGWFAVSRYMGQQTVAVEQKDAPAAAPTPQRKPTRPRNTDTSRTAAQDGGSATDPAPASTGAADNAGLDANPGDESSNTDQQAAVAPTEPEPATESASVPVETSVAQDPGEGPADARAIMEEAQRRGEAKFYQYDGLLQSFNADGKTSEKRWTFDRAGSNGRSKAVLRFTAPAEVKGVALLIHNHAERASDQWMWTPALQRDRRIALQDRSTRFFGTDFSFEDLEERDVDQSDYSLLGSDTIDGASCWKIEMTPKRGRSSHYTRSIAWIRKDNYVLVRLDHFVKDDVVKRLTNSSIENIQGVWTARQLEMADLRRSTRTRLTLQQVKYNSPINDGSFTLEAIRR
jgi:outer membrane lipoprotein-sorting protein